MIDYSNLRLKMSDKALAPDPGASLLFRWEHEDYLELFFFVAFLLGVKLLIVVFKLSPIKWVMKMVPESCLLMFMGLLVSFISTMTGTFKAFDTRISAKAFFDVLLPPIILDAAYHLHSLQFMYNLDAILLFALLGTVLNCFALGFSFFWLYGNTHSLSVLQCLLLASILAAVDPVAVLAVFNEVGVQRSLYFLIFGESLLNDGVTVVLFDTLEKIAFASSTASTYVFAIFSFLTVACGGVLIGLLYGAASALLCKKLSKKKKGGIETSIIPLMAYLAFVTSQLFHWSGILALIACGLAQRRYTFQNIPEESVKVIQIATEQLALLAETIVFLVLGFKDLDANVKWDWKLIVTSIALCIVYRFIITFFLGWIINRRRIIKLSWKHLFMMSYGGLRGAVSFAMAASLDQPKVTHLFMGATLSVIMFTVIVQGPTIRFLVDAFGFKRHPTNDSVTGKVMGKINFHVLAGMEDILGPGGSSIHKCLLRLERYERKYVKSYLCSKPATKK